MKIWQWVTEPEGVTGAGVEKLKFDGGVTGKRGVKIVDNYRMVR